MDRQGQKQSVCEGKQRAYYLTRWMGMVICSLASLWDVCWLWSVGSVGSVGTLYHRCWYSSNAKAKAEAEAEAPTRYLSLYISSSGTSRSNPESTENAEILTYLTYLLHTYFYLSSS